MNRATSVKIIKFVHMAENGGFVLMLGKQLSRKATYLAAFWGLFLHAAWTEF